MLILAGVSLNATIGDNGIITRAQETNYAQSVAIIEEYLNQYYVQNYEKMNSNDNSKVINLQLLQPNWFFSTNLGYVPDSSGNALYLLNKSGLPEDLKSQIVGGDAGNGEYIDYVTLNDVYGVTKDLKVYYCSAGLETMLGATTDDLDKDDPNRTVMSSTTGVGLSLSQFDYDGDGKLSSQEAKSIKEVTLSDTSITDISDLGNLPSLETLTLQNLTLDNVNGLEKCGRLYYIFFQGCVIKDYSNLKPLSSTLRYLYMYNLDDEELSKVCSKETGIGGKDFEKLEYLAFVGNTSFINSNASPGAWMTSSYVGSGDKPTKTLTQISYLDKLSDNTKAHVKYLSLQNNNITSLSGIEDFTGLLLLRAEYNKLVNLVGIEKMVNLNYICVIGNITLTRLATFPEKSNLNILVANNTGLTTLTGINKCTNLEYLYAGNTHLGENIDSNEKNSITDALAELSNKNKLNTVYLNNNSKLKWIGYLKNDTAIRYLYLDGCTGMDMSSFQELKSIINNCEKVTYPSEYAMGLLDDSLKNFTLNNKTMSEKEFRALKNKTAMKELYLINVTITSDTTKQALDITSANNILNEVLSTMTGLQYLQLYSTNTNSSIAKLSTIDFIGANKVTGLVELDLRGTAVTDLSNLNNYSSKLTTLIINNSNITLNNIQATINNVSQFMQNSKILGSSNGGLVLANGDLFKKLEGLENIKYLAGNYASYACCKGNIDLSGCTSLKTISGYRFFTGAGTLTLPASLEKYGLSYNEGVKIDFSKCIKLTEIYLQDSTISTSEQLNFILQSMNKLPLLNSITISAAGRVEKINDLNALANLTNSNITEFHWINGFADRVCLNDISGLKNLKKLKSLTLQQIYANDLSALAPVYENGVLVSGCPDLETISINSSKIYDLSPLRKNTKLTSITVTNSSVISIGGFEQLTHLQTLNLTNNSLYDTGSYKDDANQDVQYITAKMLGDLNRNYVLRNLYLAGNQLQDFTELNNGTTWTNKTGW